MSLSYTVQEVVNNVAKVVFDNGSWIYVELKSDMTPAEFDEQVLWQAPPEAKGGAGTPYFLAPDFLAENAARTAREQTVQVTPVTYRTKRESEYGGIQEQLEYITENGLEAWQTKVAAIKAKHPKPDEDSE